MNKTYGTDWFSQTPEFTKQVKSTKLERYGDENYNNLEKKKSTCLEKYGVDNYAKTEECAKRRAATCIKRYGVDNASKSADRKHDIKKLMFHKFLTSDRFKNFIPKFTVEEYEGMSSISNKTYPFECRRCHTVEMHKIVPSKSIKCSLCDRNASGFQSDVAEYIKQLLPNEQIVTNNRTILSPLEVDIYLSNQNIAIETDGLYWHAEISGGKNKNYHLNKTKMASVKGIRLIHVYENEWKNSGNIVKSILKNILIKQQDATDGCFVKEISPKEKSKFLEENHLNGNDASMVRLGLFNGNTVVGVMTFTKCKLNKKVEWEMSRYCSKVGGADLLFDYFVKHYSPTSVLARCDRRYFAGETYMKLGFSFVENSPPSYHYIISAYDTLKNKSNWTKAKLAKKLLTFDPAISEWENMKLNEFDRIWDCGHSKWVWTKNT